MPLNISTQNISVFSNKVDAFVVPANKEPVVGYGLDREMITAAGFDKVMAQREAIGRIKLGEATYTDGFAISRYLIHTATPMWLGGGSGECEKLRGCYVNSLKCAEKLGVKSIAFPLLSSGIMNFPMGTAYETAVNAINERLAVHDMNVYLVCYERAMWDEYENADTLYEGRELTLEKLEEIRDNFLKNFPHAAGEEAEYLRNITDHIALKRAQQSQDESYESELERFRRDNPGIDVREYDRERVRKYIYDYIDRTGSSATALGVDIGRSTTTVTRILSGETDTPRKSTAIALAVVMELPMEERIDFIRCCGHNYPNDKLDYTVEKFIMDGFTDLQTLSDIVNGKNSKWLLKGFSKDADISRG